jgi:ABC-2 type transport system ATP-binding protein
MNEQEVIQIKGLNKTYPRGFIHRYEALKEVNLSVKKAEIFGFLGPNGAGKTTLIKAILGLLRHDSGSIKLFDKGIDDTEVKNNIGYLPETPNFYSYLTSFEIMKLYARLYNMKGNVDVIVKEKLELVGLKDAIHTRLRAFSKGMLQRLGMAQALINDPELLILDEPMSGLDPIGRAEFKEIMRKLRKQGKTIFFSSHIIPDAEELCDHVAVIRTGKIIKIGTVSELVDTGATSVDITATPPHPASPTRGEEKISDGIKQMVKNITCNNEQCIFHVNDMGKTNTILSELIKNGFNIIKVEPVRQSLETLISKMIKEQA